jgi:succinate dehydrogenase/fumarate reductase cytochrome b subunit
MREQSQLPPLSNMLTIRSTVSSLSLRATALAAAFFYGTMSALAAGANFGPIPGVTGGPDPGSNPSGSVRAVILSVLAIVLNFLALLAVVFIVIAGIRLIVSQGADEQKDKAKKTILYVAIGLIVILLARAIVGFFAANPFS